MLFNIVRSTVNTLPDVSEAVLALAASAAHILRLTAALTAPGVAVGPLGAVHVAVAWLLRAGAECCQLTILCPKGKG
jgi:hypothetical protein